MGKLRRATKGTGTLVRQGKTWAVRWVENSKRRYEGGFIRQADAEAVRASIAYQIQQGRPGIPEGDKAAAVLVREVVEDWKAARRADGHRNAADDETRWDRHLAPWLESRRIDSVDPALLDSISAACRAGVPHSDATKAREALSGPSCQRVLYLASAFYRWAVAQGHVVTNPVAAYLRGMTRKQKEALRPKARPEDAAFLSSKADVVSVYRGLAALPKWKAGIATAFALGALAGLRPGEAVGLRWSDVDLVGAKLVVRQQVRHGSASVPKSGKARTVPIMPGLLKVLKAARAADPNGDLLATPIRSGGKRRYLAPSTVGHELATVLAGLKLPAMKLYDATRHTFGSLWVLAGLDIYQLSKILGHSSVVVTQRYAHLRDELAPAVAAAADIKLAG
ncbi:MAG TPA: site-specific integrase [Polyangia bacterium]|jgi:integrase|nr:site-specific integrase [Polyangia bacterium]